MLVMGILNVTPDSFADGGKYFSPESAIARGLEMISEGVDVIDIGGESTRPGADRIDSVEEQRRTLPVIEALAGKGAEISIDTMSADTAKKAVGVGASIVNDVSGGKADAQMFSTVAALGCKYILMHWRGHSKEMNSLAVYEDVVVEVINELKEQIERAVAVGIKKENIILDPGLGFSKDVRHNWEILERLQELQTLGYPILIGGSRKRFLGGNDPNQREAATIDLTKSLLGKDIWGVRVHSVKPHRELIDNHV
jgi:dihydropteroate synthase